METQDSKFTETQKDMFTHIQDHHSKSGRFMGGLIIVAVGVILLLKQMGTVIFPGWLFTWPMIVIAVAVYVGARHNFHMGGWLIALLVGGVFLTEEFYPAFNVSDYLWPILIIGFGAMMILPRRKRYWADREYWRNYKWQTKAHYKYGQPYNTGNASSEDFVDSVSFFGGVHKIITSKDFKGGDVVNVFGGSEINLMQADIKGRVVLEITQIFAGTKIIIPADWEVQSKMVAIFGNVEDKRNPAIVKPNPDKVLIIDGTSIFAGVEILSY